MAAMEEPTKLAHTLVLDTGAIIKNEPSVSTLISKAESLFTVPAIISEIKDAVTRSRVETMLMPFLTIRQPSPASMAFVTEFARRTGDLPVLSRPDLQIIALTYELECERNGGDWRLRKVPGQKGLNGPFPTKEGEAEGGEGKEAPKAEAVEKVENQPKEVLSGEEGRVVTEVSDAPVAVISPPEGQVAPEASNDVEPTAEVAETAQPTAEPTAEVTETAQPTTELIDEVAENTETVEPSTVEDDGPWEVIPVKAKRGAKFKKNTPKNITKALAQTSISDGTPAPAQTDAPAQTESFPKVDSAQETAQEQSDSESDGEGWITPANLKQKQAEDAAPATGDAHSQKKMEVAVLTTDFAMQNVILQINLNLLSSNMMRIRHVRSVVLRCQACFLICREMSKQFCPRCGKPTLTRVSCSTTNGGEFKIHLKKNFQYNSRGDRFSIPKAVHGAAHGRVTGGGKGSWGNELILAEDQKEYERAITSEKRAKERNLMDEDYLPGILTGERSKTGGRIKVGAGRNVNSKKRN
jgi:RNA-binding protein NOB1